MRSVSKSIVALSTLCSNFLILTFWIKSCISILTCLNFICHILSCCICKSISCINFFSFWLINRLSCYNIWIFLEIINIIIICNSIRFISIRWNIIICWLIFSVWINIWLIFYNWICTSLIFNDRISTWLIFYIWIKTWLIFYNRICTWLVFIILGISLIFYRRVHRWLMIEFWNIFINDSCSDRSFCFYCLLIYNRIGLIINRNTWLIIISCKCIFCLISLMF